MSESKHKPAHHPIAGTGYQVCKCGATRRVDNGKAEGGWHVCASCVLPNLNCDRSEKS